jgi:hypothetical protein
MFSLFILDYCFPVQVLERLSNISGELNAPEFDEQNFSFLSPANGLLGSGDLVLEQFFYCLESDSGGSQYDSSHLPNVSSISLSRKAAG